MNSLIPPEYETVMTKIAIVLMLSLSFMAKSYACTVWGQPYYQVNSEKLIEQKVRQANLQAVYATKTYTDKTEFLDSRFGKGNWQLAGERLKAVADSFKQQESPSNYVWTEFVDTIRVGAEVNHAVADNDVLYFIQELQQKNKLFYRVMSEIKLSAGISYFAAQLDFVTTSNLILVVKTQGVYLVADSFLVKKLPECTMRQFVSTQREANNLNKLSCERTPDKERNSEAACIEYRKHVSNWADKLKPYRAPQFSN